ncbi:(Fe-S)-binding protein, partial [Chromohalobacter sp. 296-RDG]
LGRYNGEYEAPRAVLQALGVELVEMQRSGYRSRCCGGGGGASVTDVPGKQRIPDMRMNDVRETQAEQVVVGCPQCTAMFEGVVPPTGDEEVAVKDIAEMVVAALDSTPAATSSAPRDASTAQVTEEVMS